MATPHVVILTPLKNAAAFADGYFQRLNRLTYPPASLSLGLLESDSTDGTFEAFRDGIAANRFRFHEARIWKRDFGYHLPDGMPRWQPEIQTPRRATLAKSRNHLLFLALGTADWALWLDADVVRFPDDLIERLLETQLDIVHPHCVRLPGGPTFDRNAWTDRGRTHMDRLRGARGPVPLQAVGGTVLLVKGDRHRDGLIFPPFHYGPAHPHARPASMHEPPRGPGEIETEGFGLLATDMGLTCWGLPDFEVIHRDG